MASELAAVMEKICKAVNPVCGTPLDKDTASTLVAEWGNGVQFMWVVLFPWAESPWAIVEGGEGDRRTFSQKFESIDADTITDFILDKCSSRRVPATVAPAWWRK